MRFMNRSALALVLLAAPALGAQDPHVGFGFNLSFPAGGFRNSTYAPHGTVTVPQNEGYDLGIGGQFTLSFPVDRMLAVRLNMGGQVTNGSNTAAGYDKINLQHSIFSVGGDMQIFVNGSADRHRGSYLIAGLSGDFERFDRSFGDPNYDTTTTERKSRLGGNFGFGHSFGFAGSRFTFEATYHKTLTGDDVAKYEPPATDFGRISLGWVF